MGIRRTLVVAVLAGALVALAATSARAAVGVEKASHHGGAPGTPVTLTLGCGFCFPPCVGPKGERHPAGFERGPCILGPKADPPTSFGISLVPRSQAPEPFRCGPNALCSPQTMAPPRRAPFTFLGRAVPPPGGNNPETGEPPRYLLEFAIPELSPGAYVYEIWCDACAEGRRGSLISAPDSRRWQLMVRPPR